RDALLMTVADEVADDQEVAEEAGLLDDLHLQLQTIDNGFSSGGDGRVGQIRFGRARWRRRCRRRISGQPGWIFNVLRGKQFTVDANAQAVAFVESLRQ